MHQYILKATAVPCQSLWPLDHPLADCITHYALSTETKETVLPQPTVPKLQVFAFFL